MNTTKKIEVPVPQFDRYETVKVNWEDADYQGKIMRRLFDLNSVEQGCWMYNVGTLPTLFCEEAIDPCYEEKCNRF